ncbi:alpha/beta fold hydrolase [Blastomonas sp. SL216]|uniref:alpha/beta fold hydrolase n=1 Tax=Blastomonas sp. SL216 TaxID=2995169 RepID=UPI0023776A43|nr:S9 family peptidase [Blastomonas sp. SL216]
MLRYTAALAALMAAPLAAQIATPERPVTDPASVSSPANPQARPVPLDDIGTTRGLAGVTWSADGRHIFVSTNITGRFNIWRTDTAGSWPLQITQSDEVQSGLVASRGGQWVYFEEDVGGNEYADIYRVPAGGGAVERLTSTADISEYDMLSSPQSDLIALATKRKSEGQSNLAVMTADGQVRNLTAEADPQFGWGPVAFVDGGKALIANRSRVDSREGEVWRVSIADGKAVKLLGRKDVRYEAADATADGGLIAVTTNQDSGQDHAGAYAVATRGWTWARTTPWEQQAAALIDNGKTMIVRTNADTRSTLTRLDLASRAEAPLPLDPGVTYLSGNQPLSPDGSKLLATRSGADSPSNLYLVDLAANTARPATQLAMASLTPAVLPKSTVVTFKSFDGTLVSAVMTMPFNLKRDGSNPAIVIPHGGPTSATQDGFSQYAAAFASRGYVVIAPNFRGSTGYGDAFQNANYKDLGGGDLKDTVAAKQFLVSTGYVDKGKVGIFGGSYGGFMTLMAIGRTPDEFAAAVQWFGIINWNTMYRDQDERLKAYQRGLLGTPEDSPEIYKASSPLTYLSAAKAPLLTIQGENDIRVPRGQAQEVNDLLKAKGNIVETIFYPQEGHGFDRRENRLDSLRRTVAWFDTYLKGQPAR